MCPIGASWDEAWLRRLDGWAREPEGWRSGVTIEMAGLTWASGDEAGGFEVSVKATASCECRERWVRVRACHERMIEKIPAVAGGGAWRKGKRSLRHTGRAN